VKPARNSPRELFDRSFNGPDWARGITPDRSASPQNHAALLPIGERRVSSLSPTQQAAGSGAAISSKPREISLSQRTRERRVSTQSELSN